MSIGGVGLVDGDGSRVIGFDGETVEPLALKPFLKPLLAALLTM